MRAFWFSQGAWFGIFALTLLVGVPSVCFAQIIGFFPEADSISVTGACLPPSLICHIMESEGGVDTIDIRPTWGDPMYAGGLTGERIEHCFFAVHDSAHRNHYHLSLQQMWPDSGAWRTLNVDSSFYLMGRFLLALRVDMGGGLADSTVAQFHAYVMGGVGTTGPGQPEDPRLLPNFPNPFNPGTTIQYELPHASFVRLNVYDLLGRQVALLVEEYMPAGSHSVRLTMQGFASGMYFCRLEVGEAIHTSKILLLQ